MPAWTPDRIGAAVQRVLAGDALDDIASDYGVGRSALTRAIRRHTGLTVAELRERRHALDLMVTSELGALGLTQAEVAERLGVTVRTIERWWAEAAASGLAEVWRAFTHESLSRPRATDPYPLTFRYCAAPEHARP